MASQRRRVCPNTSLQTPILAAPFSDRRLMRGSGEEARAPLPLPLRLPEGAEQMRHGRRGSAALTQIRREVRMLWRRPRLPRSLLSADRCRLPLPVRGSFANLRRPGAGTDFGDPGKASLERPTLPQVDAWRGTTSLIFLRSPPLPPEDQFSQILWLSKWFAHL